LQLLVSGIVPSGNTSILYGGFRYIDIPHTTLIAGNTYAIAGLAGSEVYIREARDVEYDSRIIYRTPRYHTGNEFVFPSETYSVADGYFGPSFTFIPEPATILLFVLGGLALRRKH
jgi:hypothetical protein